MYWTITPIPFSSYGSEVQGSEVQRFSVQSLTQNAEPKTRNAYQDVYDHAGRTRATIRGFIKYLIAYEQGQQKKGNPER